RACCTGSVVAQRKPGPSLADGTAAAAPVGSMDRAVARRSPGRRRALVLAGVAVAAAIASLALGRRGGRSVVVTGSHVTTARVVRGKFDDIISVRGRVTPKKTTFVTTATGGQVARVL